MNKKPTQCFIAILIFILTMPGCTGNSNSSETDITDEPDQIEELNSPEPDIMGEPDQIEETNSPEPDITTSGPYYVNMIIDGRAHFYEFDEVESDNHWLGAYYEDDNNLECELFIEEPDREIGCVFGVFEGEYGFGCEQCATDAYDCTVMEMGSGIPGTSMTFDFSITSGCVQGTFSGIAMKGHYSDESVEFIETSGSFFLSIEENDPPPVVPPSP